MKRTKIVRPIALAVLLGAVCARAETLYVSTNGLNNPPFTNWVDAATNIQAALNVAHSGDKVLVGRGHYPISSTIVVETGVDLCGEGRADAVTIDGGNATRCIYVASAGSTVKHLTVANGYVAGLGGGMYCAAPTLVEDCRFVGNWAWGIDDDDYHFGGGGGIMCASTGVVVSRCSFTDNTGYRGGGLHCEAGCRVERCTMERNTAHAGGGIYMRNGYMTPGTTVEDCMMVSNRIENGWEGGGGGVYAYAGLVRNCLVVKNFITNSIFSTGAGVRAGGTGTVIQNCTIVDNAVLAETGTGNTAGGGIACYGAVIRNCIVWFNFDTNGAHNIRITSGLIEYSCTFPMPAGGVGNITDDPLLTGAFRLRSMSPCIDAGTTNGAAMTDWDGETRSDDPSKTNAMSRVDIGADEFVDTDLDEMADCWETNYFSSITNKNGTADTDHDGLSDLSEYSNATSPTNSDTDADGMPDGWEVGFALNPLADDASRDLDTDTAVNLAEYVADTDPTNPVSVLSFTGSRLELDGMRIDWKGGVQARQQIEFLESLASTGTAWMPLLTVSQPTPLTNTFLDGDVTDKSRFYRIRAERQENP